MGLEWARTAFIAPQMHPFDRFFYNRSTFCPCLNLAVPALGVAAAGPAAYARLGMQGARD